MNLITLIESVEPLTWLALGLGLVLIDIFANSFFLMFAGLSVATNALWDACGLGGQAQLFLTALAFVVYAVCARKVVRHKTPSVLEEYSEGLEGVTGRVLWVDPDDPMRGRGAVFERGERLIQTSGTPIRLNDEFVVTAVEGARLFVQMKD